MFAGIALAAGAGTRLAPITDTVPKPCCEVAARPLVQLALDRLGTVADDLAVNVHHGADQVAAAVGDTAMVRREDPIALGTAGAVANLADWIAGRPVVVVNGDTWCPGSIGELVHGWDGSRVRVLVPGGGGFGPRSPIVGTLLPWRVVEPLVVEPTGLYEVVWRHEHAAGRLEVVDHRGPWVDCGTPADLLGANLAAVGDAVVTGVGAEITGVAERSAIGAGARVAGAVRSSVVFSGARVGAGEALDHAIRWTDGIRQLTLQVAADEARQPRSRSD